MAVIGSVTELLAIRVISRTERRELTFILSGFGVNCIFVVIYICQTDLTECRLYLRRVSARAIPYPAFALLLALILYHILTEA